MTRVIKQKSFKHFQNVHLETSFLKTVGGDTEERFEWFPLLPCGAGTVVLP